MSIGGMAPGPESIIPSPSGPGGTEGTGVEAGGIVGTGVAVGTGVGVGSGVGVGTGVAVGTGVGSGVGVAPEQASNATTKTTAAKEHTLGMDKKSS